MFVKEEKNGSTQDESNKCMISTLFKDLTQIKTVKFDELADYQKP